MFTFLVVAFKLRCLLAGQAELLVSKITTLQTHLKTKQEDKRSPSYGDRPSCWELFYKWKFSAFGEGAD